MTEVLPPYRTTPLFTQQRGVVYGRARAQTTDTRDGNRLTSPPTTDDEWTYVVPAETAVDTETAESQIALALGADLLLLDGDLSIGPHNDLLLVTGRMQVQQRAGLRLLAASGSLLDHASYGGDFGMAPGESDIPERRADHRAQATAQLLLDPAIVSVDAINLGPLDEHSTLVDVVVTLTEGIGDVPLSVVLTGVG